MKCSYLLANINASGATVSRCAVKVCKSKQVSRVGTHECALELQDVRLVIWALQAASLTYFVMGLALAVPCWKVLSLCSRYTGFVGRDA